MKYHKKRYQHILIRLLCLVCTVNIMLGCTLEDFYEGLAVDSGGYLIECHNLTTVMIIDRAGTTIIYDKDDVGAFANAFEMSICPTAAPNCILVLENDAESATIKGICNNCPSNYAVCDGKCVEMAPTIQETDSDAQNNHIKFNPSLHIKSCDHDHLVCNDDYHDLDGDIANGCEFRLSSVCVKKDSEGNFVCFDDYYDLNGDLAGLDQNITTNGCEFQISVNHVDKTNPKNSDGSWNCNDGYADLDDSRENGCEINGWMDSDHCGAGVINGEQGIRKEGENCINGETCIRGVCEESCGQEGIIVCGGYCVNVLGTDNAHCGDCGKTCEINDNTSSSTAAVACDGGHCHAIACNPGYRLGTGQTPNTCIQCNPDEYTTSATATECTECPKTPGASTMKFDATRNLCVAEDCEAGWHKYDPCKNSGQQSCTEAAYCDTTQHCTSSDQCANLSAGTSACVNGKCEYTCNAGYYYSLNDCTNPPYCCKTCPRGTYSSAGATQCSIVPAGYVGSGCASGYNGCTSYSKCDPNKSHSDCMQMYGHYSGCRKVNNSSDYYCTDDDYTAKRSCNRSYNGCSNNQTCKPHGYNNQNTYGYCH